MPDSDKGQDLMPSNTAVWLPKKRGELEIGPAPYPHPRENEIVVQNRAVAINPIDWLIQAAGNVIFTWLRYPFVLGCDLAGDVVEVGSAVTRFRVGDRVLGHAVGTDKKRNNPAEGAFQNYTVVLAHMAAPLPDSLAYENAAVLPLALSTAACGLFQTDHLALEHPCSAPVPTGRTLLVWGGSTSVGSNAIQLAVAAGYDVVTTCSPRNFGYVRKLGASRVFNYHSSTVVEDIVDALEGKTIAGALAIGGGSGAPCVDIVRACQGRKFVSMAKRARVVRGARPAPWHPPGSAPSAVAARCWQRRATGEISERQGRHEGHLRQHLDGQRGQPGDLPGLPTRRPVRRQLRRGPRTARHRHRTAVRTDRVRRPEPRRVGHQGRRLPLTRPAVELR